jgi:hypothetical protein
MDALNYHQILADVYEENAKNLLVDGREYESDVDENEEDDYEINDLPDKEEFNKFHGDRGKPEHVIQPKPTDKTKSALKRDTDIRNIVLNIDSAFRPSIIPSVSSSSAEDFNIGSISSWFVFGASQNYKNITSVKLTSLEFPNTFYSFSSARGNTSFILEITSGPHVGTYNIVIPDGNYLNSTTTLTHDPTKLIDTIDTVIAGSPYNITGFDLTYDPQTHKIDVECSSGSFIITFPTTETSSYKNGIGYNLGFTGTSYTSVLSGGTNKIFPEIFPDVIQDKYIYVSINDWNLVQHQSINQTYFPVFAKVQLPGTKNTIVFDSNYINSSTKEYFFQQPVNIQRLEIKLLDCYGNVLEMNGDNWSMTLELKQVNDSATYEALNIL